MTPEIQKEACLQGDLEKQAEAVANEAVFSDWSTLQKRVTSQTDHPTR